MHAEVGATEVVGEMEEMGGQGWGGGSSVNWFTLALKFAQ